MSQTSFVMFELIDQTCLYVVKSFEIQKYLKKRLTKTNPIFYRKKVENTLLYQNYF